ncbi:MAG TPA: nucleotide exchange factor GrpE [Candidatus Lokiarchaeia archaeon]|nr:nucleotide exchange factor GrpE [Candidatus Lokiarchaeia archaeon]
MPSKKQPAKSASTPPPENAEEQASPNEFEEIAAEPLNLQENYDTQLKAKDKRIAELENEIKWARADFDNFRKSMENRLESEKESMQARILRDFLPFFDTFDRAMQAASDLVETNQDMDDVLKGFFGGLDGLYKNLNGLIEAKKLKRIDALGKKFDYNYHEVSLQVEDDSVEDGTILQEIQKGWLYNGKVLRPAMVAVSKKTPEQAPGSCAEPTEEAPAGADASQDQDTSNEGSDGENGNPDENQDLDA